MSDSSRASLARQVWDGYPSFLEILAEVDVPDRLEYVDTELPPTVILSLSPEESQITLDVLKRLILAEDPRWWADLYDAVAMYLDS